MNEMTISQQKDISGGSVLLSFGIMCIFGSLLYRKYLGRLLRYRR